MGWALWKEPKGCYGRTPNYAFWGYLINCSNLGCCYWYVKETCIWTLVQACGAKYNLQEEDVDETDVDDVVVALVNIARRVSFAHLSLFSL